MGARRILQFVLTGIFGTLGVVGLVSGLVTGNPGALVMGAVMLLTAGIGFGAFELQRRGLLKKGERVRTNIEAIAAKAFDAPARVQQGYDMGVTSGAMAPMMTAMESDVGFTADGTVSGTRVSIASHASTLGRQLGEFSHVYSYVLVDMRGLQTRFRLSKEGAGALIARATGLSNDTKVGDATFDATWNVDVDDELAREVLDESIRARLMELESKVGLVSQNFGVGTMSLLLTGKGLALRWPGDIDPPLAAFITRMLLDLREKILAHEDRKAARGTAGQTYRVVADPVVAEEVPETSEERKLQS